MRVKYLVILFLILGSVAFFSGEVKADWTYTVKRGDTLFRIARKIGISVTSIKRRNGLSNNRLRIGQRLIIPTVAAQRSKTPTRTGGDLEMLARLIHAEAGAEPYLGKVAVGGVIMNRVQNSKFPHTIAGVIYQPRAFESVSNGIFYRPSTKESRKAATAALSGWDPSGGALYFFNPGKTSNRWIWARRIINRIGKHVFAI